MIRIPQPHRNPRCLYVLMTFLWSTFFMATLVLWQVIDAYPGMVKKADTDPRARMYRTKEIASIMKAIRQGDYRLVRPNPSKETEIEQHKWCTYKLNSFIMTLCTSTASGRSNKQQQGKKPSSGRISVDLHKRGFAAEAVALCLTNQPQFRDNAANTTFLTTELNQIQQDMLIGLSLAEGLFVLLEDAITHYHDMGGAATGGGSGSAVISMSQAAEAVWISSFHHPTHIENYLQLNMIDLLGKIIVSTKPESFGNDNNHQKLEWNYITARPVMWACAALQNLAAYYCDNDLGHCLWEWKKNNDNGHEIAVETLVLDEETTKLEASHLADEARNQIAAVPDLLETLAEWVCQGPIEFPSNATYGWPGDAQLWKDMTFNGPSQHLQSPSIVPWAAAAVFKNLLLGKNNPTLQTRIQNLPGLQQCLCDMKTKSPDWLEQSKSTEAIFRWSSQWETLCPSVHDNCRDDDTWENAESGDTCHEYDQERWCVEYGNDVGTNGQTANQACCACGGGVAVGEADGNKMEEDGTASITSNENTTSDEAATAAAAAAAASVVDGGSGSMGEDLSNKEGAATVGETMPGTQEHVTDGASSREEL